MDSTDCCDLRSVAAQKSEWPFIDYDFKEDVYRNITQNKYCVTLFKCVNNKVGA